MAELTASTRFGHFLKDMIDSGDFARLDSKPVKVYFVIKAHADLQNGDSFPGVPLIAAEAGMSEPTVKRSLKQLCELGYLSIRKKGRKNVYTLREKVVIRDETGTQVAAATWNYIPMSFKSQLDDLKAVLLSGDLTGGRVINIEKINLQINLGNGVQADFSSGAGRARLDEQLQRAVRAAAEKNYGKL